MTNSHLQIVFLTLYLLVQAGQHNPALKKLVDLLPKVKYAGDKTEIPGGFDPATLLPGHYCIISLVSV
jgi:carbonic anhydrase